METNLAPQQTDRKAWGSDRIGAFTASTNGKLLTEPRSKAAKEAGELSETALVLIAEKATEIIKGKEIRSAWSWEMKRGFVLEAAMKYLLGKHWQEVFDCLMQRTGIWIATPDGLLSNGEPVDIKCTNEVDMMLFADQVPEGDWEALKKWNKGYAYQVATQAKACGTTHGNLVYCTDQIKVIALDHHDIIKIHGEGLHDELGGLIGAACQRLFDEIGTQFTYQFNDAYNEPGFAFIARRFEIPAGEIELLEKAITAAYEHRDRMIPRFRAHLAPSVEEVENTVTELIEGADIETPAQHDIRAFENMAQHLIDMPWPATLNSELATHALTMIQAKVKDALAITMGTLKKDLKD